VIVSDAVPVSDPLATARNRWPIKPSTAPPLCGVLRGRHAASNGALPDSVCQHCSKPTARSRCRWMTICNRSSRFDAFPLTVELLLQIQTVRLLRKLTDALLQTNPLAKSLPMPWIGKKSSSAFAGHEGMMLDDAQKTVDSTACFGEGAWHRGFPRIGRRGGRRQHDPRRRRQHSQQLPAPQGMDRSANCWRVRPSVRVCWPPAALARWG